MGKETEEGLDKDEGKEPKLRRSKRTKKIPIRYKDYA